MKAITLTILAAVMLLTACGPQPSVQQEEAGIQTYLISEMVSNPLELEDHTVRFEGIIGHVCRHSGDKMRVMQHDDNAFSVMVMLGDFTGSVTTEFEGREVVATGVLKAEVRNLDELDAHQHDHDHHDGHDHDDHEHEDGHGCSSTEEAIALLKERGIEPNIRTYVQLTSFEIK